MLSTQTFGQRALRSTEGSIATRNSSPPPLCCAPLVPYATPDQGIRARCWIDIVLLWAHFLPVGRVSPSCEIRSAVLKGRYVYNPQRELGVRGHPTRSIAPTGRDTLSLLRPVGAGESSLVLLPPAHAGGYRYCVPSGRFSLRPPRLYILRVSARNNLYIQR